MGETLKNTKIPVKKGYMLNDEDILNDALISFKHLVSSYAIALNEASNKSIYKLFSEVLTNSSKIQADLFDMSFKKGWYVLETADETKIDNAYKKFSKLLTELDKQSKKSSKYKGLGDFLILNNILI